MRLIDTIKEKVAIHCPDIWMAYELMNEYERLGIEWYGGQKATSNIHHTLYNGTTCYTTHMYLGKISLLNTGTAVDSGYKVISYKDLCFDTEDGEINRDNLSEDWKRILKKAGF